MKLPTRNSRTSEEVATNFAGRHISVKGESQTGQEILLGELDDNQQIREVRNVGINDESL